MDPKKIDLIKLHIAGATVRHTPPFDHLIPHQNGFELTQDFLNKWVTPFYMNMGHYYGHLDTKWIDSLKHIKGEITPEIIQLNLGDFNWRTRQTGAYFSALTNQPQFIDIIGTHFLKSEVCYAGGVYCLVFASFNLPKCVDYLNLYLDYYLTKPDLWFDQKDAMEAILYLDRLNSTNHFDKHISNWTAFIKNKPHWGEEIKTDNLENKLNVIQTVKAHIG